MLWLLPILGWSQERCGEQAYQTILKRTEAPMQFEKWIKARQSLQNTQRTQATYRIPVVFHIIHNGEAIGTGTNLSEAQILSQLAVMNKDYQRLNEDAVNTPAEFLPVAGSLSIEFVLAKQTPAGLPTTGITRTQGTKSSYTITDNYTIKSTAYWPSESYLNIWICNITDYLGYAQFPESTLSGLEGSSSNALTDGVVLAYNVVGSADDGITGLATKFDKGRTATHEIGHYLGLRHIWGDDNGDCGGTDYVDDTPNQSGSTSGCPSHPRKTCSAVVAMFQNYMDYTDDRCMNVFTINQMDRIRTVLENSPRRNSLLNSPALDEPVPIANDAGLTSKIKPGKYICTANQTPAVEIINTGNNQISSISVELIIDGVVSQTKNFTITLEPETSTILVFDSKTLKNQTGTITFNIVNVNSTTDLNTLNNSISSTYTKQEVRNSGFEETFSSLPSGWRIENPDGLLTWNITTAGNAEPDNKALQLNFYNYEDNLGEVDYLYSPVINLTTAPVALVSLELAYAQFQGSSDGFKVIVLTGCNSDLNEGIVVLDKSGSALASTTSTNNEFLPASQLQWRTETISLEPFLGEEQLQLVFAGVNDWGNNLYLDNFRILTTPVENIELTDIVSPTPVHCSTTVTPRIRVHNNGTGINQIKVQVSLNGSQKPIQTINREFPGGATITLELEPVTLLKSGTNQLAFEVQTANGDIFFEDNSKQTTVTIAEGTARVPWRDRVEASGDLTPISVTGGLSWTLTDLPTSTAYKVGNFKTGATGAEAWLVTPSFDLTGIDEASVYYNLSYRRRDEIQEKLVVYALAGCGDSIYSVLRTYEGNSLTNVSITDPWEPASEADWLQRRINLAPVLGQKNIRLAWAFTANQGNYLYVDNLEMYMALRPIFIDETMTVYPNPTKGQLPTLVFNLPETTSGYLEVLDSKGSMRINFPVTNILNQSFPLPVTDLAPGIYLVRLSGEGRSYTVRIQIE